MAVFSILFSLLVLYHRSCHGTTYEESLAGQRSLLDKSVYDPQLRPLLNQSDIIYVEVAFSVVAIVNVDDISQSFRCNGFIHLHWTDELIARGRSSHGPPTRDLYPRVQDIWKPQLILINTMNERDSFGDDLASLVINTKGYVSWFPGSLFHASCSLDIAKFPFDEQVCTLNFHSMNFHYGELRMYTRGQKINLDYLVINPEWDLLNSEIFAGIESDGFVTMPVLKFMFSLRRRPNRFIYNSLLPAIQVSVLGLFVFFIPADSGEKVTYGITMLLAEAVIMASVTGSLPATTGSPPAATVYLMVLLHIEAFTVITSIIVVALNHLDQAHLQDPGIKHESVSGLKVTVLNETSKEQHLPYRVSNEPIGPKGDGQWEKNQLKARNWKSVSKNTNIFCFVLSSLVLAASTVWYFVTVLS